MSSEKKLKYTVFLIKEEYTEFDQVIEEDKVNEKKQVNNRYGLNGTIYIGHNEENQPDWFKELKKGIDDPLELVNQSTRAVMLIKRRGRIMAFTYGHGKHMIDSIAYVRGFGMRVVVNNCQVDKLKSIDSSKIDSVTVQARTQTSKSSELSNFEVNDARDLLKAVTAESTDFERYGKVIAGRDSFHFYYPFSFDGLKDICDQLLEDYHSKRYKRNFGWIDHLSEVNDPGLINSLNEKLIEEINDIYLNNTEHNIHLAPPEIINMEDNYLYSYSEIGGEKTDELELIQYISAKNPKGDRGYNYNKLKRDKVFAFNSNLEIVENWPIFNCLVTEIELEDNNYVLSLGIWYCVDRSFISEINSFIQEINTCSLNFQCYDEAIHTSENDYNESVAANNDNLISMDQKFIHIDNNKFELCDLLSNEKHLIHVKPWRSSSTLSHLFSQGRVSAQTIINTPEILSKINKKIGEEGGDDQYLFDPEQNFGNQYTIVYAIIYEGDKEIHERIPFFSKLNFMDSVKTLRSMSFNVEKMHIKKYKHRPS